MIKANRTTALLFPFYSNFGSEFINSFDNIIGKSTSNIRLYIGDAKYSSSFLNFHKLLEDDFLFVQVLEECFNFERHLLLIQSHENYITDYEEDNYRVIVLKLNDPYVKALREFKQSNYSKMYNQALVDNYFSTSRYWYMMYANDSRTVKFDVLTNGKETTLEQMEDKWNAINAKDFYKNLIISPYHMFRKSENLRKLLSIVYNSKIPKENELITKINLKDEILNYED